MLTKSLLFVLTLAFVYTEDPTPAPSPTDAPAPAADFPCHGIVISSCCSLTPAAKKDCAIYKCLDGGNVCELASNDTTGCNRTQVCSEPAPTPTKASSAKPSVPGSSPTASSSTKVSTPTVAPTPNTTVPKAPDVTTNISGPTTTVTTKPSSTEAPKSTTQAPDKSGKPKSGPRFDVGSFVGGIVTCAVICVAILVIWKLRTHKKRENPYNQF